jgi:hypothetical protein
MDRRTFVRSAAVAAVAIPAARLLAACTTGSPEFSSAGDAAPGMAVDAAAPADLVATTVTFVSTVSAGHQHPLTLEIALFASPPADGVTRLVAAVSGHDHGVTLSRAELEAIGGGGTITKTTSTVDGHAHTFSLSAQT